MLNRAQRRRAESKFRRRIGPLTIIYSEGTVARARADADAVIKAAGIPASTPYSNEPTPWGRDDAAWFAAHPDRSHRARGPFPGERYGGQPSGEVQTVVVQQIRPGLRARTPFTIAKELPVYAEELEIVRELLEAAEHDEAIAATMFDLTRAGRMVSFDEISMMIDQHDAALARVKS